MVTSQDKRASTSTSEEKLLTSIARSWHVCERYEILGVPCPFRKAQLETNDTQPREKIPLPRGVREPVRPRKPSLRFPKVVGIPVRRAGGGQPPNSTGAGKHPIPLDDVVSVPVPRLPPVLVPPPPTRSPGGPTRRPTRPPIPVLPDGIPGAIASSRPRTGQERTNITGATIPTTPQGNLGGEPFPFQPRVYNTAFNSKKPFSLPQQVPPETARSRTELPQHRIALMEQWVRLAALAEEIYAPHFASVNRPLTTTSTTPATSGGAGTEFDSPRKGVTVQDVGKAAAAATAIAGGAAALSSKLRGGGGGGFQFPSMPGNPDEGLFRAP